MAIGLIGFSGKETLHPGFWFLPITTGPASNLFESRS